MSDNLALSLQQFIDAWRVMCTRTAGHVAASEDGVEYIFSGVPIAFFNVAILTGRDLSADRLRSLGRRAGAWAAGSGVPWLLVVTHDGLAPGTDAASVLDACGLGPMMPMTGMLAARVAPPARIPDGLSLMVPEESEECAAILDVNGVAYGMDLEAGKPLIGTRAFWNDHVGVLGKVAGRPACCAAVMMIDGHRYVALVATDPGHQRKGYAEAAMRHALALAAQAHGELPTVLHASEAGRPIYERMGYLPISRHTVFTESRFLHGA
jgi:GNAT superfamily N-acetyltransferase